MSDPGLTNGQVPSAEQWNGYFQAKADNLPTLYTTPLSGDVVSAPPGTGRVTLTPAGGLATLLVVAPASPVDNQQFSVSTTTDISALTVGGGGATLIGGGPFVLAANGGLGWVYRADNSTWYRSF